MNILTFFHLCDNDSYVPRGQAGYNPVSKLGTIYSVVTEKFSSVWKPGKNICIDEGMIPFRGKVHFKVYNPDKPDKYGVKSYQLCDSSNGYCCMFEIYTGVDPNPPRKRPGKESSFQCTVCKVALCIQDCFQLYHTVQDYVAAYVRKHDANNDDTNDDN